MAIPYINNWDIELDTYLDYFIPYPRWHLFPRPVAHFLGYREETPPKVGNVVVAINALVGAFLGLLIVAVVDLHIPSFTARHAPIVVGSFGASAVLEYCAIDSPLAQPRSLFFGHTLSTVIGVGISKLFQMRGNTDDERLFWIAGPLACAVATMAMSLTKTVHPPGGATALLACVDAGTRNLGWFLIPIVLLSISLMMAVSLLVNNIQRRFPVFWWCPHDLRPPTKSKDAEVSSDSGYDTQSENTMRRAESKDQEVIIRRGRVLVPDCLYLTPDEKEFLEKLSSRI